MVNYDEIFDLVKLELSRATEKWPVYYKDIIHSVALVNEEAGESIQAALDYTYADNGTTMEDVRNELIQTAAMCFRSIENMDRLKRVRNYLR